jgi:hypothetical protein
MRCKRIINVTNSNIIRAGIRKRRHYTDGLLFDGTDRAYSKVYNLNE